MILTANEQTQLILTGCDLVSSYDPLSGKQLWERPGATTECVTSAVTDGQRIFTSGGYPKNHVAAMAGDGSGNISWERPVRVYVPSLLCHDNYLYGVADAGIAHCWESASGEEMWKSRLPGVFSSSPVLAADHIYATNETGTTYVLKADPKSFSLVARNQLPTASEVYATPTFTSSRIYLRAIDGTTTNQQILYCIGNVIDAQQ